MRQVFDYALVVLMFVAFVWAFLIEFRVFMVQTKSGTLKEAHRARHAIDQLKRIMPSDHRKQGAFKLIPVLFMSVVVAILTATLTASYRNPGTAKIVELRNVKVLRDIGRYEYWLQTEQGSKFFTIFCADYEPQFSAGQTLLVLKYEDRGNCWSVANTHPAYLIRRDANGKAIKE